MYRHTHQSVHEHGQTYVNVSLTRVHTYRKVAAESAEHSPDDQTHPHHQRLGREIRCLIIHEEIVRTIPQYNGLPERGHQVQRVCVRVLCLYDKPLVIAFPPNEAEFSCSFMCA